MQPLAGVTVVDLSRLLPGPYCTWLLRSWGARVIKVEDPAQGDYLRDVMPVWFNLLGAGAESIALDLRQDEERSVFLRMVREADLVVESFRPGVLHRLGLGFEQLISVNPRVVLVSLPGFSPDLPKAGRAGHDVTYLARSGLLSLMSEIPPVQLADLGGGLTAAAGALAALHHARTTGEGLHVEASLEDALVGFGALLGAEAKAGAPPVRGTLPLGGALPCYAVYETADGGRMALGALEAKFWSRFVTAVGRPEWEGRPLDPSLKPDVAALFRTRTLDEWTHLSRQVDFCLEPVLSIMEAVADRDSFQPVRFGGHRPSATGRAPRLGEHSQTVRSVYQP